ncbi:dihydrofolate reductase [Paenibacillus puerhi]|uniref:dihydrofolate reductase n=1 Tax=Paenibacillus puerhi TaxID=2692622 RepID=UPI0013582EF5|nr:dihydrofolate reductase [Paenibacillus puerhi]
MHISLVAAMGTNRVIGNNNTIPWRLPKEQAYVRKLTMGKPLIMGRKNYESIGRPLDGRRTIIVTRNRDYAAPGCTVVHSPEAALAACREDKEVIIFGGEDIYRHFLPIAHTLYLTRIDHDFEGDTFFPEVDLSKWTETSVEQGVTDADNPYTYYYHVYTRGADLAN